MIAVTSDTISDIFDEYADMVFRISVSIVRNREEAQDVVMDTFLALIGQQRFFESGSHIKAWLIRTAENKSINVVKSGRVRRSVPLDEALEGTLAAPSTGGGDLLDMVMRLPDKLKTVIYLFYYEDMTAAQIADALGISENTVYKRLERGRRALKIDLEEDAV